MSAVVCVGGGGVLGMYDSLMIGLVLALWWWWEKVVWRGWEELFMEMIG